jgi:hypothetical protein
MKYAYPPDLVPEIKKAWVHNREFPGEERPELPPDDALEELLNIAYHTSLLKEEGRQLAFRLVVMPRNEHLLGDLARPTRIAKFATARPLTASELRRLAPAADATRSMICADLSPEGGWAAWGLLDTGANWWQFVRHEADSGTPPPSYFTISSTGPGEFSISTSGYVLVSLGGGSVYYPQHDVLGSGPVSNHLEPARRSLYRQCVKKVKAKKWDPEGHDNDYPKRFYTMCLSRILLAIQELHHGGTLLLLPSEIGADDSRLADRVNIKHPCNYDYAWDLMTTALTLHREYYDLHFPLWDSEEPISPDGYQKISRIEWQRDENDEALLDCLKFIASLSAVDGAVVLNDRLTLLGFGAEVIAQSPALRDVQLATDANAQNLRTSSIENYGTRHRSAFRFCSSYEDAIAFIVSQDGGIKAVKRIGPNVIMWPDVRATPYII